MNENQLTILSCAWGGKNLGYLEKMVLPSVALDLASCGYERIIYRAATVGSDDIGGAIERGIRPLKVELQITGYGDGGSATTGGIRSAIDFCLEQQTRLLFLVPDIILSLGGVRNMREYARGKPVTVAAPHLRVNENTFLEEFSRLRNPFPMTSTQLVGYALTHAHQTMRASYSHADNATDHGGISITQLCDKQATIIHYVPSPTLCWFTESDRAFFKERDSLRAWDHIWPSHLYHENRLRVFGSSNLFFGIELTDPHMNNINVKPGSKYDEQSVRGLSFLRCIVGELYG